MIYNLSFDEFTKALCGDDYAKALLDGRLIHSLATNEFNRFYKTYYYVTKKRISDAHVHKLISAMYRRYVEWYQDGSLMEPMIYRAVEVVNAQHDSAVTQLRVLNGRVIFEMNESLVKMILRNGWPRMQEAFIMPSMAKSIDPNVCNYLGHELKFDYSDLDYTLRLIQDPYLHDIRGGSLLESRQNPQRQNPSRRKHRKRTR